MSDWRNDAGELHRALDMGEDVPALDRLAAHIEGVEAERDEARARAERAEANLAHETKMKNVYKRMLAGESEAWAELAEHHRTHVGGLLARLDAVHGPPHALLGATGVSDETLRALADPEADLNPAVIGDWTEASMAGELLAARERIAAQDAKLVEAARAVYLSQTYAAEDGPYRCRRCHASRGQTDACPVMNLAERLDAYDAERD